MRRGLIRRAAAALAWLAAGCSANPTPADPASGTTVTDEGTARFERAVRPFVVLDEHGREYAFPFLGGFDAPRPSFQDIDGDGDLDVFVQELSGELRFFENAGSASAPRYEWRTDRYQGMDVGEWYRFVDLDADGVVDLLTEEPISYIRHWKNQGTRTEPRFVRADSLRDDSGRAIFMDRQNIPAVVDVDCDGRLDLFVGRVEGTVARFEADAPGSTRFVFVTELWEGIEIVGTVGPGSGGAGLDSDPDAGGTGERDGTERNGDGASAAGPSLDGVAASREARSARRHGANALAFADFDGDRDVDLFWGDFFEPGVLLIENVGPTCSSPSFRVEPVSLPYADSVRTSGYNAPAPVDLDGDGLLDFAMGVLGGAFNPNRTTSNNIYQWERTAPERFELRSRRLLDGIDAGSESAPAVVDLDGDGALDLVVGSKLDPGAPDAGALLVFRNEGGAGVTRLRLTDTLRLAAVYNPAPAFGDVTGDGRPDVVLGTWSGDVLYFRAEGPAGVPRFVQDSTVAFRLPRGSNATPALGDLDGDGDLDLLVGQSNGAVALYRNEGSPRAPRFALVQERLDSVSAGRRSTPALIDLDDDGLLDLVLGREGGGLATYRNAGTRAEPRFVPVEILPVPLPPMSSPVFADIDRDGTPDLISGTGSGGLHFWKGRRPR